MKCIFLRLFTNLTNLIKALKVKSMEGNKSQIILNTKFFRIYKTILEMLSDRGYNIT